jgi:putative ABC transport system substrate-binding protein
MVRGARFWGGRHGWLVPLLLLSLPPVVSPAEVAVLKSTSVAAWQPTLQAFRQAASGHVVTESDLQGSREEAARVLGTLKDRPVIVVAMGPLAAEATRRVAPGLPMVFSMVADPDKLGLLGLPNVVGVAFSIPVIGQFAAFRSVNPRAVRIGIIYNPQNTGALIQQAQTASRVVRTMIVERPVPSEREVPQALRELLQGDDAVDALWLLPDPVLLGDEARRHVMSETLKARKAVYAFSRALVPEGALASDGPDYGSIGQLMGMLVNRIANGESPGAIGMQVPQAELVINKKVADRLRVEIPRDTLKAATVVE